MDSNKQVVLKLLKGAFVERDAAVVDRYFSPDYVQHNPTIPNGPGAIASLIPTLKDLSYEVGMVVAEGDLVMVHGRYVGWGPKPLVAVDIFKVKDGKVVRTRPLCPYPAYPRYKGQGSVDAAENFVCRQ